MTRAATALYVLHNSRTPHVDDVVPPVSNASFKGTGLGVYALKNFSFADSKQGAHIVGSLGDDVFADGRIEGCGVRVNCSDGVDCGPLNRSLQPAAAAAAAATKGDTVI